MYGWSFSEDDGYYHIYSSFSRPVEAKYRTLEEAQSVIAQLNQEFADAVGAAEAIAQRIEELEALARAFVPVGSNTPAEAVDALFGALSLVQVNLDEIRGSMHS